MHSPFARFFACVWPKCWRAARLLSQMRAGWSGTTSNATMFLRSTLLKASTVKTERASQHVSCSQSSIVKNQILLLDPTIVCPFAAIHDKEIALLTRTPLVKLQLDGATRQTPSAPHLATQNKSKKPLCLSPQKEGLIFFSFPLRPGTTLSWTAVSAMTNRAQTSTIFLSTTQKPVQSASLSSLCFKHGGRISLSANDSLSVHGWGHGWGVRVSQHFFVVCARSVPS